MLNLLLVVGVTAIVFYLAVRFAPQGWRTIAFNVVAAIPLVGGELASVLTGFDWGKIGVGPQTAALIGLAIIITNIVFRKMTSTPMGKGE